MLSTSSRQFLEDAEALAARRVGLLLDHTLPLLLAAVGTASEEDDDHAEEQANERRKQAPDCDAERCVTARTIVVDVMVEYPEETEVDCQRDQSQDPGQKRYHGTHKGSDEAMAASEQEGDEGNSGLDWVEHQHASEAI